MSNQATISYLSYYDKRQSKNSLAAVVAQTSLALSHLEPFAVSDDDAGGDKMYSVVYDTRGTPLLQKET